MTRPPLPPGPWLVVGLARSGVAAARALAGLGEEAVGVDAGSPEVPGDISAHLGTEGLAELERARAVVKSPGVPREAPVIAEARRRGVPVLGELELAWRLLGTQRWVLITGTNGKTTTTELLGAIHREAGLPHAVVGNVGTAASALAGTPIAADATIIAEASSFQLEDAVALAPEAAALLNVEPDHLDRHGTFEDYRAAKLRAFEHQDADAVAYAPPGIDLPGAARRVEPPPLRPEDVRLRGPHNLANARAAAALALALGVDERAVGAALRSFRGVPHRLEEVAERDGVLYVNDSKATNVASTLVALGAFPPGTIHLLLGGRGKGQDFGPLRDPVARACRSVRVFGEDARALAAAVAVTSRHETMEEALEAARGDARPGDVLLLSPACASYDQFRDFEARGDRFRALAQGI